MSAWVLPDHIADALPSEARHLEGLRRSLIDTARSYGYELVMPPLLEHLESLLTGVGKSLELQTFKLVDQLSGRMLGLRADTTQQVARIDAHLLNREGLTRLCYCGPVVHARPDNPRATREPLQFGAEIYGYAEIQADVETLLLALDCLQAAGVEHLHIDLGDARIVRAILKNSNADPLTINLIQVALAAKDSAALQLATQKLPSECIAGLYELLDLYGDESVLDRAAVILKDFPEIEQALAELKMLSSQISGASVSFDLSDLSGYSYYSGLRFSIYTRSAGIPIARGGRYDEVGAVFGRNRPAVGFSLDLRTLVRIVRTPPLQRAIGARWLLPEEGTSACSMASFRAAVKMLRNAGETVVCMPDLNIMYESEEFFYDRVLVLHDGHWILENFNANQSRKFGNE